MRTVHVKDHATDILQPMACGANLPDYRERKKLHERTNPTRESGMISISLLLSITVLSAQLLQKSRALMKSSEIGSKSRLNSEVAMERQTQELRGEQAEANAKKKIDEYERKIGTMNSWKSLLCQTDGKDWPVPPGVPVFPLSERCSRNASPSVSEGQVPGGAHGQSDWALGPREDPVPTPPIPARRTTTDPRPDRTGTKQQVSSNLHSHRLEPRQLRDHGSISVFSQTRSPVQPWVIRHRGVRRSRRIKAGKIVGRM